VALLVALPVELVVVSLVALLAALLLAHSQGVGQLLQLPSLMV